MNLQGLREQLNKLKGERKKEKNERKRKKEHGQICHFQERTLVSDWLGSNCALWDTLDICTGYCSSQSQVTIATSLMLYKQLPLNDG